MSEPIHVLIVEDNASMQKSMRHMLELNERMSHAGSFSSAEECLEQLTGNFLKIDVVLLDLRLPGANGPTLIPFFVQQQKPPRILILTQDNDYHTMLEAIQLGASGYVLKTASIGAIELAIQEVYEGGCVIDPQLSRLLLDTLGSGNAAAGSPLTDRERQILELLAVGYVKKEVASQLQISYRTVAEHTENIYQKLQVRNVASAVASAVRRGLI